MEEEQAYAEKRYKDAVAAAGPGGSERLVTGSDDFTMFLWDPIKSKKPLARMTGHQQLINNVAFSPDGCYIASASFDKSIKLWNGLSGKYLATLRGHVGSVYQVRESREWVGVVVSGLETSDEWQ